MNQKRNNGTKRTQRNNMDIIIMLVPIGAIIIVAIYFNYKMGQLKKSFTEGFEKFKKTQLKLLETTERVFPEPHNYVPTKEEYTEALSELDDSDINDAPKK